MKVPFLLILLAFAFTLSPAQTKLEALDKDLTTVAYPFPVKFYSFDSQRQSLRMAYMDVTAAQPNGKNIVLLHGKNFNGAYWEQTVRELTGKGFRVIVPDQIGFGKSTKPAHYQFSFHQLAANTRELLESVGVKKATVVGHSMGGMLAARFALMYPGIAERLVLINPIGLEDYGSLTGYQTIDAIYQAELKNTAESYKNYQLRFYYDNKWKPEYDKWLNMLAGWTLHKDYSIVAWNAALTADMIFTQPVVREFPRIKQPTLLIIGTRDRTAIGKDRAPKEIQPAMGRYDKLGKAAQKLIPNAKLVELNDVGHMPHIESFDRVIGPLTAFVASP